MAPRKVVANNKKKKNCSAKEALKMAAANAAAAAAAPAANAAATANAAAAGKSKKKGAGGGKAVKAAAISGDKRRTGKKKKSRGGSTDGASKMNGTSSDAAAAVAAATDGSAATATATGGTSGPAAATAAIGSGGAGTAATDNNEASECERIDDDDMVLDTKQQQPEPQPEPQSQSTLSVDDSNKEQKLTKTAAKAAKGGARKRKPTKEAKVVIADDGGGDDVGNELAAAATHIVAPKDEPPATSSSPSLSLSSSLLPAVKRSRKKLCLLLDDFVGKEIGDRVLSCGEGEQLGHPGRTTTKKPRAVDTLPADKPIKQVVAGGVHSLILFDDGTVYSCGINEKGTVPAEGVEPEGSTDRFTPIRFSDEIRRCGKLVMLTAGASFSAGLTDKGTVIAWGNIRDSSGCIEIHQLLREMEQHPVIIVHHRYRVIVKVSAGENHLVMLSESGDLLTFGDASMGQLGRIGRVSTIRSQQMVDLSGEHLKVSIYDRQKHQMKYFTNCFAGGFWTAAITDDNQLFVCGLNNFGHLGVPLPTMQQTAAKPGEDNPELRIMRPERAAAYVGHKIEQMCGVQHIIALDDKGDIYGIGKNTDNALGLNNWTGNDDTEHWRYTQLMRIDIPSKVIGITAKLGCSIAWTNDGDSYSWGCDTSGQLGLGIKDDDEEEKIVGKPTKIKSAHLDGYRIIGVSIADNHSLFIAKKI